MEEDNNVELDDTKNILEDKKDIFEVSNPFIKEDIFKKKELVTKNEFDVYNLKQGDNKNIQMNNLNYNKVNNNNFNN